jgi:hypothetical protein
MHLFIGAVTVMLLVYSIFYIATMAIVHAINNSGGINSTKTIINHPNNDHRNPR